MALRQVMNIFYAVNAIRKIQYIKPLTVKIYQYLKKLDKNLEETHFKSTLESFVKNGYFVVQAEAEHGSYGTWKTWKTWKKTLFLKKNLENLEKHLEKDFFLEKYYGFSTTQGFFFQY